MNIATGLDLVVSLAEQAFRLSAMLKQAHAEGREGLTDSEVEQLALENTEARQRLQDAIEAARNAS